MNETCIESRNGKRYSFSLFKRVSAKGIITYRVLTTAEIIFKQYKHDFDTLEEAQTYYNEKAQEVPKWKNQ